MRAYEFHPAAAQELDDAVAYYEAIVPGKGMELAAAVRAAIKQVCEFPESAPAKRAGIRAIVVQPDSRWDYTVYYRIKTAQIRVLAIAHQARQPFYWFGQR